MIKLEGSVQLIRTYKSPSLKLAKTKHFNKIYAKFIKIQFHVQ